MSVVWTIYTDGAARGNPGPAAYAFVIERPGDESVEHAEVMPDTTNNVAEYTALVEALERAAALGGTHLVVNSDSELMVKQMAGEYRVKSAELRPLYDSAIELQRKFAAVTIQHVRRGHNKRADQLCNLVLDGEWENLPDAASVAKMHAALTPAQPAPTKPTPDERALAILREAAAAWARGNANDPTPASVWARLRGALNG